VLDQALGRNVDVLEETFSVADHVRARDRKNPPARIGERLGMGAGIRIHSIGEGLQVGAKLRRLRLQPCLGATGNVVDRHPSVALQFVATEILGGPSATLSIESQQQLAVALHLGPAEAIEEVGGAPSVDMRHAVTVPEDFAPAPYRCG
jgi:hypothetical protein